MKQLGGGTRTFAIGVAAITIAAAALAAWHLGRESFWMDEGVDLAFTRASWAAVAFRDNGNSALYLLLLKAWNQAFSGEAGVRLLSLIPFVATVPVVGMLGRRVGGTAVGLVAAAVVATNSETLFWARGARGYSLEIFLIAVSMLLMFIAVDERRGSLAVGAVVAGAAAAWVQPIAVLVAFFFVTSLWLLPTDRRPARPLVLLAVLGVLVVPLAIALVSAGTSQISWLGAGGFSHLPGIVLNMMGGHAIGLVIGLFAAVGIVFAYREHRDDLHSVEAWRVASLVLSSAGAFAVIVAVSVHQSLIDQAYILVFLPSIAILVGLAVTKLPWPTLATAAVAVTALASAAIFVHHDSAGGEDIRGAEAAIASRAQPGDVIVLNPTPLAGGFELYLDEQKPSTFPDPIAPPGTWGSLPVNNEADLSGHYLDMLTPLRGHQRVWFVQRLNGSPQDPESVRAILRDGRSLVETIQLPKLTIELYEGRG